MIPYLHKHIMNNEAKDMADTILGDAVTRKDMEWLDQPHTTSPATMDASDLIGVTPASRTATGVMIGNPAPVASISDQLFAALKSPNPAQVAENMRKIVEGYDHNETSLIRGALLFLDETLTIIDMQAMNVMQDDVAPYGAILKCGWVHEKCKEALLKSRAALGDRA